MNESRELTTVAPLTVQEVKQQVNRIQEIMGAVMKEGVHYGTIPGTGSKSLWKPGAEKIVLTFRLVPREEVEDLSSGNEVRYRVKTLLSGPNDNLLGEGFGECSSYEEKFAWREAICAEEWEATEPTLRRIKFKRDGNSFLTINQIRTNPADQLNAVLKRAKKRSLVDAVLTVTAASDCFDQEIEEDEEEQPGEKKAEAPKQQAKAGAMLDGILKSATPCDGKAKKPGRVFIAYGNLTLDLGFWDTPADLVKEPDWRKLVDRPCRFSFSMTSSKGRDYKNLTFLQFIAPAEEKVDDLFPGDRMAEEERAAMQQAGA